MKEFDFDVFLSHNGRDKPVVRELKRLLSKANVEVWLDQDELPPGRNWQPLIERGIRSSRSIAVLVGSDGLGPVEVEEMLAALELAFKENRPIIPTLLPGCPKQPELPMFLGNRTWVDLRGGYTERGMGRLIWGITGEKPTWLLADDEPVRVRSSKPADLWPEVPGAADCYRRLGEICEQGEVPKGEERKVLWNAVKRNRPASFQQWQLANLARWSAPEYLEVEERFTPLQVNVRVRERAEAPAEKQQLPFDTLAEAMDAVFDQHSAPASVIFAPPGGGKSTLLRHYQLSQAQYLAEGERLVFYTQLRDYRPDKRPDDIDPAIDNPAMAWLEAEWQKETAAAPPLFDFIRQGGLTLLLDGLNEIPRDNDGEYRQRVAEWRELIDEIDRNHPGVRLLFACRPLDYSQRLDAGRHTRLPEIEVQAMEPERIKAFIERRFTLAVATQVWDQLENHPSLELYSSPYYLNLLLGQIDSRATEIVIPQNRAALFSGMVREQLRRECQKGIVRFSDPALLSERDRTVLMGGKPRDHWLPDDEPFFEALAALAFHIQDASGSNERWGTLRWKQARRVIEAALEDKPAADLFLYAACDLGLFEDDAAQAKDIRFIHQQMQEYFAAWVLAQQTDLARLSVPWRSTELGENSTEALLDQGGDDDLPELPTTGWEEAALIAASLSDAPETFIRALLPANLTLAGRCAAQAGLAISDSLRHELQQALLERSQSPEADLRARIAAGKALGELGDPRLQAPSVKTGIRVLLPQFAAIPGGEYIIGGDPEGFQNEFPQQRLRLNPFELALHPVTNAEYACFVTAGGYQEDAWWPGRGLAWRNGEIGQEGVQRQVRTDRQTILDGLGNSATPEQIRDHYKTSLINAKWWQERISASEDEFEAWLLETYPPPSGPFVKPRYWRSLTWGNPAQPVVGV
ncbi:MAG: TIR domain-containing protein, partial [Chromatiales bacterium]